MNRKILSIMLSVIMIFSLLPNVIAGAEASGSCGTDVVWVLSDDGTLTISGSGKMADYSSASVNTD